MASLEEKERRRRVNGDMIDEAGESITENTTEREMLPKDKHKTDSNRFVMRLVCATSLDL